MECSICIYAEKEKKKREKKMLVCNVIRILNLIEFEKIISLQMILPDINLPRFARLNEPLCFRCRTNAVSEAIEAKTNEEKI